MQHNFDDGNSLYWSGCMLYTCTIHICTLKIYMCVSHKMRVICYGRFIMQNSQEQLSSVQVHVFVKVKRQTQIINTPARSCHWRHTIGHQHCSDKPSHLITDGHVPHRAPDTAVISICMSFLTRFYWGLPTAKAAPCRTVWLEQKSSSSDNK